MCGNLLNYIPAALAERETATLFCSSAALSRRVCPSTLPARYWISTCAEVDVTSARLSLSLMGLHLATLLDVSVLESASWLDQVLAMAVHICKINASAELSARPTMAAMSIMGSSVTRKTPPCPPPSGEPRAGEQPKVKNMISFPLLYLSTRTKQHTPPSGQL